MLTGYPTREPDSVSAGDTLCWERTFASYPASQNWSLEYSIIGLGEQVQFTSVADGDSHAITVPPSVTQLWLPTEISKLAGYAVNSVTGERHEIYFGFFPIKPNLANAPADQPSATFNEKLVYALENLMLSKTGDDILQASVGDSHFKFANQMEVYNMLCLARRDLRHERAKAAIRNGKPSPYRLTPRISITPVAPPFGTQWPIPNA